MSRTTLQPEQQHAHPGTEEQLADERILLRRNSDRPTEAMREELVKRFMPLAKRLARRYAGGAEPLDDLFQVASMGLVKAIDRYDPERGTRFSTFAVPTILGELKRHFRDRGWSIRVPRGTQELILKVEKATAELPGRLGREPTVHDIARWLEVTDDQVLDAMSASRGHHTASLDRPASADAQDGMTMVDRIGGDDLAFDTVEYAVAIEPVLAEESERDRRILHLRFAEDKTQSEIAKEVGISQMHVSRLLRATLDRLREGADAGAPQPKTKGEAMPPRGVKKGTKRARQYEKVKKSEKKAGRSNKKAAQIAAATVNKERARSGESRTASNLSKTDISSGRRGGKRSGSGPGGRTRDQLYAEAKRRGVEGRSSMNKAQLARAVGS